jgi:hypothetical protein
VKAAGAPMTDAAVALFIYNRPDLTSRVFGAVAAARPPRLFVFADGPDPTRADDIARTAAARAATDRVDWPCEVQRDYAGAHLGIKRRVESGLARTFAETDRAIVLEDDCLPDPTFFPFVNTLLERYRDDARVTEICGCRRTRPRPLSSSYALSRYRCLWGWATWRRAWQAYDGRFADWPRLRAASWLEHELGDRHAAAYWTYQFDRAHADADAGDWDVAWVYSAWRAAGLSIVPAANLVANLGFRADATHTRDPRLARTLPGASPMPFPLRHPASVAASPDEDRAMADELFSGALPRVLTEARRRIHARRA